MSQPSLVGGLSLSQDFAPSIIFAVIYVTLACLFVFRLLKKKSRTAVLQGTPGFIAERIAWFCLRAVQAKKSPQDQKGGLIDYMQVTLGIGFLALLTDVAVLLRCICVNSTYPSQTQNPSSTKKGDSSSVSESKVLSRSWLARSNRREDDILMTEKDDQNLKETPPFAVLSDSGSLVPIELEDQPRRRFWFRRAHGVSLLVYIASLGTGIAGNSLIVRERDNESKNLVYQALRMSSAALALFLALSMAIATIWARKNIRRVNQVAIRWLASFSIALAVPAVYRLVVMHKTTTSYSAQQPGSFNSPGAKATFYIFHILPETFVSFMLVLINVKQMFGTGSAGDVKWRDETPEEKEKREKKEREKREKKMRLAC